MADEFGSTLKGSLTLIAEDDDAYFSPGEWSSADKAIL